VSERRPRQALPLSFSSSNNNVEKVKREKKAEEKTATLKYALKGPK